MFNVYAVRPRSSVALGRSLSALHTAPPPPPKSPSVHPVFPTSVRRPCLTLRMPQPINPVHGILSKPFADSARNFLPHQETICIPGSASILTCLTAMDKAHLRSCMICLCRETGDCLTSSPRMGVPCCMQVHLPQCADGGRPSNALVTERFKMLDMRDILKFLISRGQDVFDRIEFTTTAASRRSSEDASESEAVPPSADEAEHGASNQECTDIVQTVLNEPAGVIANISGKNKFQPCWIDDPLESLIKAFDTSPRVPLFAWDANTKVLKLVRIFSATDLFALFHNSDFIPKMDNLSNQTFSNMLSQPVGALWKSSDGDLQLSLDSDPLLETMRRLVVTGFTALPIVDRTSPRKTLGVISVRDFRQMLLRTENIRAVLSLSTLSYVAQVRQIECLKAKFPSISVNQNTPLRAVVQKMLAADIQRIFLVDDKAHITGIFSRTDLGRIVARTVNSILNQVTDQGNK
eukprot:Gregarina_sp_Pseudo_9__303@NODE_1197_length_1786_cov_29_369204_g1123_i0_p1_GENE_NODE_1197_length_1786_cov_29_369204_g1123_i0NODE_1197_length_1786_cov_29_369204_g1123_i0_p1_ORF_typecomplete_len464_score51_71CBS/PF00571_28/1_2e03CBS/PF00571_28/4_5e03CBS/PF00571_28/0_015CBS/PF00571_28/1_7e05_NODE_1197_length_1786_cov_29_369204_g1123_i0701461